MYVIGTTFFNQFFLFCIITERHCFLSLPWGFVSSILMLLSLKEGPILFIIAAVTVQCPYQSFKMKISYIMLANFSQLLSFLVTIYTMFQFMSVLVFLKTQNLF